MTAAHALLDKANGVANSAQDRCNAHLSADRPTEAKRELVAASRELRLLKREAVAAQREIRLKFKQRRLLLPRRSAGPARRLLAAAELKEQDPYEAVKAYLEEVLVGIERAKVEIEGAADVDEDFVEDDELEPLDDDEAAEDDDGPPPPPVTQATPAQWSPDPGGRHELRYWNGTAWTDHVSDAGVVGVDSL